MNQLAKRPLVKLRIAASIFTAAFLIFATAAPAGAVPPQPVDASEQGGIAFVLFAVMCGLFAASLFYMDRVRRRRSGDDELLVALAGARASRERARAGERSARRSDRGRRRRPAEVACSLRSPPLSRSGARQPTPRDRVGRRVGAASPCASDTNSVS